MENAQQSPLTQGIHHVGRIVPDVAPAVADTATLVALHGTLAGLPDAETEFTAPDATAR